MTHLLTVQHMDRLSFPTKTLRRNDDSQIINFGSRCADCVEEGCGCFCRRTRRRRQSPNCDPTVNLTGIVIVALVIVIFSVIVDELESFQFGSLVPSEWSVMNQSITFASAGAVLVGMIWCFVAYIKFTYLTPYRKRSA